MENLYIKDTRLVTPDGIYSCPGVRLSGGKIAGIGGAPMPGDSIIDAKGLYLSAGFIDIHTHGIGGHDYMDGGAQPFLHGAQSEVKYGCTTFYPTSVAASEREAIAFLHGFTEAVAAQRSGANMPGVHLEGSYFAPEQAGAQDPAYIVNPDPAQYRRIFSAGNGCIKRWSAAPELPGALEFGDFCTENGILASAAHTDALTSRALEAVTHGYTHATHIYSGMSIVRRIAGIRYGGMVEAALLSDDMSVEMICDGMHLPKELLRLIYKVKGAGMTALITDSMRAAGTDSRESILGSVASGRKVIIRNGVAWMPSGEAFAGSVATCDRLVRTAVNLAEIPLHKAVEMMTATPARIMGIGDRKGSIKAGMDADLTLFDGGIRIFATIVGGETEYSEM